MDFRDFEEFKNASGMEPSHGLTVSILGQVRSELQPSAWLVFSKLLLVHLVVGAFALSLCPQFGVRLFGDGIGLVQFFSRLGNYGCMLSCGALFMGLTALATAFLLNADEFRALRKTQSLQIAALALLSLGFFVMWDARILFGVGLAWFCGALIGGRCFLTFGWALRRAALRA